MPADMSPRARFDAATERLVDAAEAGDRAAAVQALADAESFLPSDTRTECRQWLDGEQARLRELDGHPPSEPRGWAK